MSSLCLSTEVPLVTITLSWGDRKDSFCAVKESFVHKEEEEKKSFLTVSEVLQQKV